MKIKFRNNSSRETTQYPSYEFNSPVSSSEDELFNLPSSSPINNSGDTTVATAQRHSNSPTKKSTAQKVLSLLDSPRRVFMPRTRASNDCIPNHYRVPSLELRTNMSIEFMDIDSVESEHKQPGRQNILSWLHDDAPQDIIPNVLSFAGPQLVQALSCVNKSWQKICLSEGVFRDLCEATHKWKPGRDPDPASDEFMDVNDNHSVTKESFWRDYYCNNPVVPTDYSSIHSALSAVSKKVKHNGSDTITQIQTRNVRIFLHPGTYLLRDRIMVHGIGNTTVSFETLECPIKPKRERNHSYDGGYFVSTPALPNDGSSAPVSPRRSLRDLLTCRSRSESDIQTDSLHREEGYMIQDLNQPPPRHATIFLKTKKNNEPLFHVQQGKLKVSNLSLLHFCSGTDIWNGNAAVQIQPPFDERDEPILPVSPDLMPTALLEKTNIVSISGRGIVAIDGGVLSAKKCYIHHCAATGIYVGGRGSEASIEHTDVIQNGIGNQRSRRGVVRGHSGIYLEQGVASLVDCNVSNNALTGVSAVSRDNSTLIVKESDLMGNGSFQLEVPPVGTLSNQRSVSLNNHVSVNGTGRCRSGLIHATESEHTRDEGGSNLQRSNTAIRRAMFLEASSRLDDSLPPSLPRLTL
jgi:hypothetical protein